MALPIIEKNWEKPQMSIKEELVESWHIHTMDFYIDIKKKEAKLWSEMEQCPRHIKIF